MRANINNLEILIIWKYFTQIFRSELEASRRLSTLDSRKDSFESDWSDATDSDMSSLSEPALIERRHSVPADLEMVRYLVTPRQEKVRTGAWKVWAR